MPCRHPQRLSSPSRWTVARCALGGLAGLGALFTVANAKLGARGPRSSQRREPYECGLPSERPSGRVPVGFYLVGLMFLIFDLEVVLLYPTAVVLRALGLHGLLAIGLFIGLLGVAFVYEWRRGALDWTHGDAGPRDEAR